MNTCLIRGQAGKSFPDRTGYIILETRKKEPPVLLGGWWHFTTGFPRKESSVFSFVCNGNPDFTVLYPTEILGLTLRGFPVRPPG